MALTFHAACCEITIRGWRKLNTSHNSNHVFYQYYEIKFVSLVTAKKPQNNQIRKATVSKYPAWLFCAAGQQQKFFL